MTIITHLKELIVNGSELTTEDKSTKYVYNGLCISCIVIPAVLGVQC